MKRIAARIRIGNPTVIILDKVSDTIVFSNIDFLTLVYSAELIILFALAVISSDTRLVFDWTEYV